MQFTYWLKEMLGKSFSKKFASKKCLELHFRTILITIVDVFSARLHIYLLKVRAREFGFKKIE